MARRFQYALHVIFAYLEMQVQSPIFIKVFYFKIMDMIKDMTSFNPGRMEIIHFHGYMFNDLWKKMI